MDHLVTRIHPLDWFQMEVNLRDQNSDFCALTSELEFQNRSFLAATSIHAELTGKHEREQGSWQRLAYLNQSSCEKHTPIVFDTGASFSLTPYEGDFVGEIEEPTIKELFGIADSVPIKGIGWIEWTIRDVFNNVCLVRTRAFLVPKSNIRLFSPQTYFNEAPKGDETAQGTFNRSKLEFTTHSGQRLTFPYSAGGNLPIMLLDWDTPQVPITSELQANLGRKDGLVSTLPLVGYCRPDVVPAPSYFHK